MRALGEMSRVGKACAGPRLLAGVAPRPNNPGGARAECLSARRSRSSQCRASMSSFDSDGNLGESEDMAKLKEHALTFWNSLDGAKPSVPTSRGEEVEDLRAQIVALESQIRDQTAHLEAAHAGLMAAEGALSKAMRCLDPPGPEEDAPAAPPVSEEDQEEEGCDVNTFSDLTHTFHRTVSLLKDGPAETRQRDVAAHAMSDEDSHEGGNRKQISRAWSQLNLK